MNLYFEYVTCIYCGISYFYMQDCMRLAGPHTQFNWILTNYGNKVPKFKQCNLICKKNTFLALYPVCIFYFYQPYTTAYQLCAPLSIIYNNLYILNYIFIHMSCTNNTASCIVSQCTHFHLMFHVFQYMKMKCVCLFTFAKWTIVWSAAVLPLPCAGCVSAGSLPAAVPRPDPKVHLQHSNPKNTPSWA